MGGGGEGEHKHIAMVLDVQGPCSEAPLKDGLSSSKRSHRPSLDRP